MEQDFIEFSEFRESDKSLNMNRAQFKEPISHMHLAGSVLLL